MDSFLSPTFQVVSGYHQMIVKHLSSTKDWHDDIQKGIETHKGDHVNAFHTFFHSINDLDGSFSIQVLRMSDMQSMYPNLIHLLPEKGSSQYLYIFSCNNGISTGTALIAHSYVSI